MSNDYDNLIAWPFQPDMSQDIVETFGYLTDVLTSASGMEQRAQLRAIPVGSIGFSIMLRDKRDAQLANALLHGHQAGPFGVGRWQFAVALASDADAGDTTLTCETEDIPFEVGGFLLLWRDPRTIEIATVVSAAAGLVTLEAELVNDWPAGTYVMPMVVGRLSDAEAIRWESLEICSQELTFDVDGFTQ